MTRDLLLEIGVEELPSSFVAGALKALPKLVKDELSSLRLKHGGVWVGGTARRLAVIVSEVAESQPDLDEEVLGPPARVAFDADGKPTRAAEAFAKKLGVELSALSRKETPKGEYLCARKQEQGASATELLPDALTRVCGAIPFRKSMRWSDGDVAFGRPVRWLVALFGEEALPLGFAGVDSARTTQGHRFLGKQFEVAAPGAYVGELREQHVLVDSKERADSMLEKLRAAAKEIGGELIEDQFLVGENLSLVEEPHIVAGGFEESFLALPERVVLDVAKDHQRYFGVRGKDSKLLPRYLAVVNTAENPGNVRRGNDRVMRARLSDAKFFYDEDLKHPLEQRKQQLDAVVFHKSLGSVGDKVRRIQALVPQLANLVGATAVSDVAVEGAGLAKCDLVTLMVGEFPELQGEMGMAYSLKQGKSPEVAAVIAEHYLPRGADDGTAPSDAGALVALADRLDTLVGCFAVGLIPTGAADPLALRRATLGCLRTLLDKRWSMSLATAFRAAYAGYSGVKLGQNAEETSSKLADFFRDRLRGLLVDRFPQDVVDATLATGADDAHDVELRCAALAAMDPALRATAGEVFKRAANIAKDATSGAIKSPGELQDSVQAEELALFDAFGVLGKALDEAGADYGRGIAAIAAFAPTLAAFFEAVFVMTDDLPLRENRLRLMREIETRCSAIANFNLLAKK
ncbi:MAG: glycine--tRNA ligase subunit beta [Polyangiaceae bacterium]|nr:glycine--tRNA ligase subunit beta [Myxococcales bacterium]MCB9589331.1 glycine--tRNA ligase subunit beta [Polyangiaceae bacterium]